MLGNIRSKSTVTSAHATHTHTREEDLKRVSAVVVMKVLSFSPLIFPMQGRTGLISVRTMERLMMLIEKKEREKG